MRSPVGVRACGTHTFACVLGPAHDIAVRHIQPSASVTALSSPKFMNSTVESQPKRREKKSMILCWASFTAVLSCVQDEGWAGLTGPEREVRQGFALSCISVIPLSHCPKGKAQSPSRFSPFVQWDVVCVTLKGCPPGQTGAALGRLGLPGSGSLEQHTLIGFHPKAPQIKRAQTAASCSVCLVRSQPVLSLLR